MLINNISPNTKAIRDDHEKKKTTHAFHTFIIESILHSMLVNTRNRAAVSSVTDILHDFAFSSGSNNIKLKLLC